MGKKIYKLLNSFSNDFESDENYELLKRVITQYLGNRIGKLCTDELIAETLSEGPVFIFSGSTEFIPSSFDPTNYAFKYRDSTATVVEVWSVTTLVE